MLKKIRTAWSLLKRLGPRGFWAEVQERRDPHLGRISRHGSFPDSEFEISVIVPTYNGGSDLANLLVSLAQQRRCRLEILVLDSGSSDGSQELVARYSEARWIPLAKNEFSHSGTRNRGVALTRYPLVFFTVQDAELTQDTWLYRLASILKEENLGALAAAEAPRLDADPYARYSLDSHYRGLGLADGTTLVHRKWKGSRREKIRAASIGNVGCLYRRELLTRYPFEGTFGEDFTLGMRLVQQGIAVGKTAELKVLHSHTRPAFYGLKRMFVSRRLMKELGLSESAQMWDESSCLALVASLSSFFDGGWDTLERLDPALSSWVSSLGIDLNNISPPHQTLVDIVEEVRPYAAPGTEEMTILVLKALAGRVGWVLGAIEPGLWSTEDRKKAVEGLANGV